MSNPVQSSTTSEPGPSLASRYPRTATVAAVATLFVVSVGLLYAMALAVAARWSLPVAVLAIAAWFLSVLLLALVTRPYFHRLKTRTRAMPEGLCTEVLETCARNGVAVRRSWTAATVPGSRQAGIYGLPWDRHLVVDEWFFASLSPAEREALFAREAALVRNRYQSFSHLAGPAIVAGVAALLAVASVVPFVRLTGASASFLLGATCAGLYALAARRGIEKVYAADRHAARQTGERVVIGVLEKAASRRDGSAWHRWPRSVLAMGPTTGQRIERLDESRRPSTDG